MKQKGTILLWLTFAILGYMLCGCAPDEKLAGAAGTGNPSGEASFSMKVASMSPNDSTLTTKDQSQTVFTINETKILIARLEFEFPDSTTCENSDFEFSSPVVCYDDKLVINGPYTYDLIKNVSTPPIGTFDLPVGDYDNIKIQFVDLQSIDSAAISDTNLIGFTMIIGGTFNYAGNSTRSFKFHLRFNEIVKFLSQKNVVISEKNKTDISVVLEVDTWFNGVNIKKCLTDNHLNLNSNGNLVIKEGALSRSGCLDLETKIRTDISNSGSFRSNIEQ